jgi:hypothetical protein
LAGWEGGDDDWTGAAACGGGAGEGVEGLGVEQAASIKAGQKSIARRFMLAPVRRARRFLPAKTTFAQI